MKNEKLLFTMLILAVAVIRAPAIQASAIVEYPFMCPSCSEEKSISVRYAADGTSVLEMHDRGKLPLIDPSNESSKYLPGAWIAGPMTDFHAGRIQRWDDEIGTNFIEVRKSPALRLGARYVDNRLTEAGKPAEKESWSIENFSVSVTQGDDDRAIQGHEADHLVARLTYTRNEHDQSGAETKSEKKTLEYDLWMSDALPFSPLPFEYEPFKGNHVPPYTPGPIEDLLVAELTPKLEDHGALVRAAISDGSERIVFEMTDSRDAPSMPLDKFKSLPVVSGEQVDAFAGPLFIASLLRGDMVSEGKNASINIEGRELAAVSEWKVNKAGDLAIVLAAKEENTSVFLVRPIRGRPDAGTYAMTRRPDSRRLRTMSQAAIKDHASKFQIYGIVQGETLPTVLTGSSGGEVVVNESSESVIAGEAGVSASALATESLSDPRTVQVKLSFDARSGLEDFRFRSNESRVVDR